MGDILLDYAFSVNKITQLPAARAAYIKQVLAIVKPLDSVSTEMVKCTSKTQATALTANEDVLELFDAGLSSVYILPANDLNNLAGIIEAKLEDFFTILISSDFTTTELSSLNKGAFKGIIGYSFTDTDAAKSFTTKENQVAFYGATANKAKNMFFAFGKMLSSAFWKNQQYVAMPYDDNIKDLNTAKTLFNDRISFALTSATYGTRLAFFAAGQKAITSPYIIENLKLDAQSAAVSYITLNNPDYTVTDATLLENHIQEKINAKYVDTGLVVSAKISITLVNDNFRATGTVAVPQPKALWGVDVDLIEEE